MTTKPIPMAVLCIATLALTATQAATTLNVGDLSIVGYSGDNTDQIAFVTWKDLDANTTISFTDRGWRTAANTFTKNPSEDPTSTGLAPADGNVTWTSGVPISAGTIIIATVQNNNPDTAVWNIGSSTGDFGWTGLTSVGESIFAYQGSASAPALLFGLYYYDSTWASADPGQYSTAQSQLPSVLNTAFGNIVTFTSQTQKANGYYSGSYSNQGSLADYKALVTNPANWTIFNGDPVDNLATQIGTPRFTQAPEPSSLIFGMLGVLGAMRRRR